MKKTLLRKKRFWSPFRPAAFDPLKRRETRLRRIRAAAAAAAILAVAGGAAYGYRALGHSRVFEIARVEVDGLRRVSREEIDSLLSIKKSATLWDVDLDVLRDRLLSHPWVKSVHVRKSYPNVLSVAVTEREPAAVVQEGKRRALVDESGRILDEFAVPTILNVREERLEQSWPTLVGVKLDSLRGNDGSSQEVFREGMNLLERLPRSEGPPPGAVRVDMSRPRNAVLEWNGYRVLLGAEMDEAAWRRFQSVYSDIRSRKKEAAEIDLRFPDQVIVR